MYLKTTVSFWASLILCCIVIVSCASSTAYFKTPNDVLKMNASVTMKNGTVREGLLTVLFEKDIETNVNLISFIPADTKAEEKLQFSDIQSYTLNGNTYVAKQVNLNTAGTNRGLFVKRLSSQNSKIQLYQLEQKYKSNPTGEDRDFFYIAVPAYSATQLIELHSSTLVPSFENKMAAFVADCSSLSAKIKNKEKGYTYNFLTATFRKVEVMKRIIQEYDACDKH